MQLPDGLTRYTGANAFTAQDAVGNVFAVFQGPNDSGVCVMRRPDGTIVRVAHPPILGRPSLDANPHGLWIVGNKEAGAREFPPRYRVAEYVPFSAPGGGGVATPEPAIDLDAMPVLNNHADYRDNAEVLGGADRGSNLLELIQRGWLYIRVNRIRQMLELLTLAVEQLQRQAKARGDLR